MPSIKDHGRQYDLVVFGATGYTGKLTAEYITTHLPTSLKWAVAGRSESKLQGVVDACKKLNPDRSLPAIEIVNLKDEDLYAIARKTFVLLTSVGPYSLYGEHAFKACAELGTHYVDVTGESPWVHSMIKKYEATAKKSGAILFPQSGVESAPADLCTWALAKTLRNELGVQTRDVKISLHKFSSAPSGGTLATALAFFDVYSMKEIRAATKPFAQSPIPHPETPRQREGLVRKILGVCSIPNLGIMTTSAMASTDAATVERTWGLLLETPSRKNQFYGPKFTFSEYLRTRNHLHAVLFHLVLSVGAVLIAFVPPIRALVKRFVYQPGEGAEREQTEKDEIELRGVADPDSDKFGGKQAYCRAQFRGGIYFLTGIFLAEIASTLLEEDVELPGGVYTPACLGQPLLDRLDRGGFHMESKIIDN